MVEWSWSAWRLGPARHPLTEMLANPVAAMTWSPGGDHLIGGDQDRQLFVCRFDSEWLADLAGMA